MKITKPSELPIHILKEYPEHAKLKLAHISLSEDDYSSLEALFDTMDNPYIILNRIFSTLNYKALEFIISKIKNTQEGKEKLIQYCSIQNIMETTDSFEFEEISSKESIMKASNIIKLVLDYQRKDDINTGILEILSTFLTKEEFENFISFKEINLSNFPELNLSYYKFDKLEPILLQKHSLTDYILNKVSIKGNILDLLLSRTYSDKLSVEKISNIYSKLYNLSPISKEIITYTAALISKNNSIKIIFSENINSSYNAVNNIIQIDINFIKNDIFNIESVLIHEMGHYIYEQLFETGSKPFSFEKLKNFTKDHRNEINDNYLKEGWAYEFIYNTSKAEEIKQILDEPMLYEKVARQPIIMAAKLLKMNVNDLDRYVDSNDIAEYFKDHSYIDLFLINSHSRFGVDIYGGSISIDVMNNIYNIYYSKHNICHIDNPLIIRTLETTKDILKWVTEEFLYEIVTKFDLSPTKIHFLERIADYVNRGTHILDPNGRSEDDDERHVELTVRSTELRAAGVEPELIESFVGIEQIHIKTASPKICDFILSSEISYFSFDGEGSSLYTCLEILA